jgi:lysylphosphatidylglycerol synthetase-like protein (DUF2156 family)
MSEVFVAVKAAAGVVDAWLAEPDVDRHTAYILDLMRRDPQAFHGLIAGLAALGALLTEQLALETMQSTDGVLCRMLAQLDGGAPEA